jgi:RNA polymerase sigma-70 factor, ECF subfamily
MRTSSRLRQVFQMQLGLRDLVNLGWLFSDETSWRQSPSFTLPWRPDEDFNSFEYVLPGELEGQYKDFPLKFNGSIFVLEFEKRIIRFAIHDPLGPLDFRGFPFLRAFPYIGKHKEVLEAYKLNDPPHYFLPLMPLDLLSLDELYLKARLLFVGITPMFGLHVRDGRALGNSDVEVYEDTNQTLDTPTNALPTSDNELIEAAQRGDDTAFQKLLTIYIPLVFRLAFRMIGRVDDAETVTQEVFLRMYQRLSQFKPESGSFKAWLMRIARDSIIDDLRRDRATPASEQSAEKATTEPEAAERAISQLDPALSSVFILREIEQLSPGEVAMALGVSESEITSRLHHAREELRAKLNLWQYDFTEGTIERLRDSRRVGLPQEFEKRLHAQVQRWRM